jgi:hypothetical protein
LVSAARKKIGNPAAITHATSTRHLANVVKKSPKLRQGLAPFMDIFRNLDGFPAEAAVVFFITTRHLAAPGGKF